MNDWKNANVAKAITMERQNENFVLWGEKSSASGVKHSRAGKF